MSEAGPTQGAERHGKTLEQSWTGRPWLARLLRLLIFVLPIAISFGFSVLAGRVAPADRLGINRWLWIAIVFMLANVLLVLLRRLTSRFIPLVALMKLTLVFPDNAPSRTKAALRNSNSRKMLRSMRQAQANGEMTGETRNGDYLVQLLKEVNDHDRLTRGHSERVRAYSELLGAEIGLGTEDMNKLRWAALLHDVGKLTVPSEILNKDGRPTDEEWKVLSGHPAAGIPLLEPLREWLGDWVHAADQHHCRWDGGGYPAKLAGTDISLAGRIVAIADAYDVMTSTRSYKKAQAPEVARQELTDCAGSQFDPELVRAFLSVGLGRLKAVSGPLAWLSNLTGSAQLPAPAANAVSSGAWSAGVAATGVMTVAVSGIVPAPEPLELALEETVVVAEDVTIDAVAGTEVDVLLSAQGENLTFTVGGAAHAVVTLTSFPEQVDGEEGSWQATASYAPSSAYVGEDAFGFEVCDLERRCDQGTAVIRLSAAPEPPTTEPTTTTTEPPTTEPPTTEPTTTQPPITLAATTPPTTARPNLVPVVGADVAEIDEDQAVVVFVLSNDTDPEGAVLSITGVGDPIHGAAALSGTGIRYEPPTNFSGPDQFTYTVSDGINPGVVGTVSLSVRPINDAPSVEVGDSTVDEDALLGSVVASVGVVDPDSVDFTYRLASNPTGLFSIDDEGRVVVAAPLDFENSAIHNVIVGVSDGDVESTVTLQVTIRDVDEAPTVAPTSVTTAEDVAADINLAALADDPEGLALTYAVPGSSEQGATLSEVAGIVTYTPAPDFVGDDSFTYTTSDPAGNASAAATVAVTVTATNDAPTAQADSGAGFVTSEDVAFTTADVRANDDDVDNAVATSTVEVVVDAARGDLTNNGDGTFSYVPDANLFGDDTFEYRLVDQSGTPSESATVTISVTAVNDPPAAADNTLSVDNNAAATTVDLRLNDTDIEDDELTVISVTDGVAGTVVLNADGTATYTHDGSTTTSDSFTYTVRDAQAATDTATVTVSISPRPDYDGVGADDNCPVTYNPNQIDTDGDGIGDACDPSPTVGSGGSIGFSISLGSADSQAVDAADFDGDGDADVVFANHGEGNTIFRNSAFTFVSTGQSLGTAETRNVAIGDFDGDGDPDLAFANGNDDNTVWLNDGAGDFSSHQSLIEARSSWDVAAGDVDGDGDVDLVFANSGSDANTVWWNDGDANFTNSGQMLGSNDSRGVEMADVNGDNFLDLSFSNHGENDTIFLNNGSGVFSDSGQDLGVISGFSHASRFGDLDGDGDPDLVIAGDSSGDTIWFNNGNGVFVQSGGLIGRGHSRAVSLGDIDGDGDLDIAFGDHVSESSTWINNGNGVFSDSGERTGSYHTEGILLVDIDGDGDLGLIEANDDDSNRLYSIS